MYKEQTGQRTEHTSEISEGFGSKRHQEKIRKQLAFLQEFIKLPVVKRAARAANIKRGRHYDWLKTDPTYAKLYASIEERVTGLLEDTLVDRALYGVEVLVGLKENFERAMQHRPVLDAKGKETGIYAYNGQVANRALELIGKELGMFVDRSESLVWDGDPAKLTDAQLDRVIQYFDRLRATTE